MGGIAKILELVAQGGAPVLAAFVLIMYYLKNKEVAKLQGQVFDMAKTMIEAMVKMQEALVNVEKVVEKDQDVRASIAKTETFVGEVNRRMEKFQDELSSAGKEFSAKLEQFRR